MLMKQKLVNYIQAELLDSQQTICEDQELLISGLIDSIGVMRLVTYIEHEVGHAVPPQDVTLENFTSVKTINEYLSRLTG